MKKKIIKINITICIFIFLNTFVYSQDKESSFILVEKGFPKAVIAVSASSFTSLNKTAIFFQSCIEKSTGVRLPFINEINDQEILNNNICINLDIDQKYKTSSYSFDLKTYDSFKIDFSNSKQIWVIGNSAAGVEFAIYEFLERFLGIRWLFPGDLGEYIPKHKNLIIKSKTIIDSPVFISRKLSGLHGKFPQLKQWARRNREVSYVSFHHNINRIFPVKKYIRKYPHIYPQKNGKPYVPYPTVGWQVCFSESDTITIAVQNILSYFSKNPQKNTFSLGPNDSTRINGSGYCKSDYIEDDFSSWGFVHASDSYYKWANKVVEQIIEKYPNKLFGTLAYFEIAMPPKQIKVNKNIIPFLTEDRLRWVDSKQKNSAKKWIESWMNNAHQIGFYDYIYGTPYLLPRVYFHHMADVYRYAAKMGVSAVYAEAYPNWGEGPKYYLALKLFWNPFLDVDELLEDWYICAVGKLSAPYLSEYYNIWEKFWTQTIKKSTWFKNKGMYLPFKSPEYLDIVNISDIYKSRQLLEKTVEMSQTFLQKKRANLFLKAFEYYEASAFSYWGLKQKRSNIEKDYAREMNRKRYILIDEFEYDPFFRHPARFDSKRYDELNWDESWIRKLLPFLN